MESEEGKGGVTRLVYGDERNTYTNRRSVTRWYEVA